MSKKDKLYPDTKNGIYSYEYPEINGMKQYVQIRGCDRNNPVMLFLHGGPGGSVAGCCDFMQCGWEKEYTVVNYDQRNTCKTYLANKEKSLEIAENSTLSDYLDDVDGVIGYLHTVLNFNKIIIVGFSWGSLIGAEYVKLHPEKIEKYLSIGQCVNFGESVAYICGELKKLTNDPIELEAIRQITEKCTSVNDMSGDFLRNMQKFGMLGAKYIAKDSKRLPIGKILCSPYMNFREKKAMLLSDWKLNKSAFRLLLNYDFRDNMNFNVPVMFVFGSEDTSCPSKMLADCFENITAPSKKLCIIEKAGHSCFFDMPEEFGAEMRKFITDDSHSLS